MYPNPSDYSEYEEDVPNEAWRSEVASRLSSYRAKKKRRVEGNYSMHLDFDGAAAPDLEASARARANSMRPERQAVCDTNYYRRANSESFATVAHSVAPPEPEPRCEPEIDPIELLAPQPTTVEPDPDFDFERPRELEAQAEPEPLEAISEPEPQPPVPPERPKVIFFPRPAYQPPLAVAPSRDELAEAVTRSPRILDVPEDIVPTVQGSLFAEINLETEEQGTQAQASNSQIEVPLPVARVTPRFYAGAMDAVTVLVANAIFMGISWSTLSQLPHTKPFWGALAVVPVFFWAVYEFMFLAYGGQTPGMQMARLRLSSFDGRRPSWSERRRRALYTVLSGTSIGLGFLWSLVDEDTLCWHDRITRTFLTEE